MKAGTFMPNKRAWPFIFIFVSLVFQSASAEKTNLTPGIIILGVSSNRLVIEVTNSTDSTIMVDLAPTMGSITPCVHLLLKSKSGNVMTTNSVSSDGYWTPYVLQSSLLPEDFFQNLVGIAPGSRIFFRVPIEPFLWSCGRETTEVELVSPKLIYYKPDGGESHKVTGEFFNIAKKQK